MNLFDDTILKFQHIKVLLLTENKFYQCSDSNIYFNLFKEPKMCSFIWSLKHEY